MSDVTSVSHLPHVLSVSVVSVPACFLFVFFVRFERSKAALEAGIRAQERRRSIPVLIGTQAASARRLLSRRAPKPALRRLEK